MAQRVKAAGMGFLLDLHYSDTWADPGRQIKPEAWLDLPFDDLVTAVHDYTVGVMLALEDVGALPEIVQVGNEITPGMLHPDGLAYDAAGWDRLAILLRAGLSAVKEVDPRVSTMLHIDRGGDNAGARWWIDEALSRNLSFDILGLSCYELWHGEPDIWEQNFVDLASRYPELSFVIAEYGDNHRRANDIIHNLPRGLGTFVWEPTASGVWGEAMFFEGASNATLQLYDQMAEDYGLR